jgi:Uma2 family endonuclease
MVTVISPPEEKILLHDVSWETYEQLLANYVDSSSPRFAYDRGVLEIMILSAKHEEPNRTLALLVEVLAEEFDLEVRNFGSTTFKREDLEKGFEPDSCFYIQSVRRISGKKEIDLTIDPPPDLIIEIDISNPSLNKFPIYAALGVPEIWRYDGQTLTILKLEGSSYSEAEASVALPRLTNETLDHFIAESESMGRRAWLKRVRAWARA